MFRVLMLTVMLSLVVTPQARSQDEDTRPRFQLSPGQSSIFSPLCVRGKTDDPDGSVSREREPSRTVRTVPRSERVTGTATFTVSREAERTYAHVNITSTAPTMGGALTELRGARDALGARFSDAGATVIAVETLAAFISDGSTHDRRVPGLAKGSHVRIGILIDGFHNELAVQEIVGSGGNMRVERVTYDYQNQHAAAEDQRPEMEQFAREHAAYQAGARQAVLRRLLSSELTGLTRSVSATRPEITVKLTADFQIEGIGEASAGGE